MNSVENSKQHTDVLTEEEELEQKDELLPKEEKFSEAVTKKLTHKK